MGCGGDQVEFRLLGFPTKASGINIEREEGMAYCDNEFAIYANDLGNDEQGDR